MSEKEINALLGKFKAGRTDAMLLNLDGRNYYLVYEKADIQGRMLGSTGLPGGENLSMQTSAGKTVQVTYQMDVPAGFLSQKWKIEVCGKAAVLRPTGWIRKVKGTVDVLEEVKK